MKQSFNLQPARSVLMQGINLLASFESLPVQCKKKMLNFAFIINMCKQALKVILMSDTLLSCVDLFSFAIWRLWLRKPDADCQA